MVVSARSKAHWNKETFAYRYLEDDRHVANILVAYFLENSLSVILKLVNRPNKK